MKRTLQFVVCSFFCITFLLFAEEGSGSANSGAKSESKRAPRNYSRRRYYNKQIDFGGSPEMKMEITEEKKRGKTKSLFGNNDNDSASDITISREHSVRRPAPRQQKPVDENNDSDWLVNALMIAKGDSDLNAADDDNTKNRSSDSSWLVDEIAALRDVRTDAQTNEELFLEDDENREDSPFLGIRKDDDTYESVFSTLKKEDVNEPMFREHDAEKRGAYDIFKSSNQSRADDPKRVDDNYSEHFDTNNKNTTDRYSTADNSSPFGYAPPRNDFAVNRSIQKNPKEQDVRTNYSAPGRENSFSTAPSFKYSFENVSDSRWKSPFDSNRSLGKTFGSPAKSGYKPAGSFGSKKESVGSSYSRLSTVPAYKSSLNNKKAAPRSIHQWD